MTSRYRHVITLRADSGEFEPLAKHLESGAELTLCMREFLAAHLRGEVRFNRGRRATFAQEQLDRQVSDDVKLYGELLNVTAGEARDRYLDAHPNMNPETLRSILKRHRAGKPREARRLARVRSSKGEA